MKVFGLHAGIGRGLGVEPRVDDHDRHVRGRGLDQRRHDFARSAGCDRQHIDAGLDQVLDDLHLLLDVNLTLGRLHLQGDAKPIGRLLRAPPHVHEERMVQRLQHERDGRLVAGPRRLRDCTTSATRASATTNSSVRLRMSVSADV